MKFLITGYTGFVAQNLIRYLNKKKCDLTIISRKKIENNKFKTINLDLSKKNISIKKIINKKIDCIIHTSSIKMNKKMFHKKIIEKNLIITENLIRLLNNLHFNKIINLSSSSLYPNVNGNFDEKCKTNFLKNTDFPYALSKYYTELMLNSAFDYNKILHLRISQIFGNEKDQTIASVMKENILKKNKIYIFGNGNRVINLIHIDKLIKYIYLSIKKNLNGIYNLSDYSISIKKLSLFIKARYGNKNTKIILKNKNIPNPKFFLILGTFLIFSMDKLP
jgi:nucleoside-diphosphate-sugar epimerase